MFNGVKPQGEGDEEQGYNHQFVPTVRGYNRSLRNEKLLSPLFPIGERWWAVVTNDWCITLQVDECCRCVGQGGS